MLDRSREAGADADESRRIVTAAVQERAAVRQRRVQYPLGAVGDVELVRECVEEPSAEVSDGDGRVRRAQVYREDETGERVEGDSGGRAGDRPSRRPLPQVPRGPA
jgi:hypothetical protein